MLLSRRLTSATLWLLKQQETKSLRLAYFSVSSGAAAAIISASKMPEKIFAIVSKSGRPDLSKRHINLLRTPILFITGGDDEIITEINEKAYIQVPSEKEMVIIPDADYLFDEPNASMEVAKLSLKWFKKQLREKS
jgi:alpha/beta superfamily hydrolase